MTYDDICTKDIVSITHEMEILNAACYGLIPGDCVPMNKFYTLLLLIPDDVARWIYHVIMFSTYLWYTKYMITIIGLVHRHKFVVITWNYQMLLELVTG